MSRKTNFFSAPSVSPAFPSATCDSELQESTLRVVGRRVVI